MGQGPRDPRGPGLQYRWMEQGSWVAVTLVGGSSGAVASAPWRTDEEWWLALNSGSTFPHTSLSLMARLGSSGEVGVAL